MCVCVCLNLCVCTRSMTVSDAAGGIVVLHSCKYDDICFHETLLRLSGVLAATFFKLKGFLNLNKLL